MQTRESCSAHPQRSEPATTYAPTHRTHRKRDHYRTEPDVAGHQTAQAVRVFTPWTRLPASPMPVFWPASPGDDEAGRFYPEDAHECKTRVVKGATLTRQPSTSEGTFGRLAADGLSLHTLELPWVDANGDGLGDPMKSCITPGSYHCEWRQSPKYGWCYEVTGVKGRSHILIHPANFAGSVEAGWQSQLLGCIAPGRNTGVMPNEKRKSQRCVLESRGALNALHAWANKESFMLTITQAAP